MIYTRTLIKKSVMLALIRVLINEIKEGKLWQELEGLNK